MKKVLSVFLACVFMLSFVSAAFAAAPIKGDVDLNGSVTTADARMALRQAIGLENLSARQLQAARVTGKQDVTTADARVILRIAIELTDYEAEETRMVEEKLASMTTKEKIEQMLMPDVRYFDGAGMEALHASHAAMLRGHAFGGVILYAQNTVEAAQTVKLTETLQTANKAAGRTQLLIGIDQEGGKITRLATGTQTPGNMALGAIGDPDAARQAAGIIGEELASLCINTDFAPVLDVNNEPANPVIGVRSFSDNAAAVATMGAGYIGGLQDQGVIATLKHFPGHGDTGTDSHTGLPRIEKSYAQLKANELVPFAAGIAEGAEMIMTAHIQYPNIEKTTYVSKKDGSKAELPATLSKKIITDILRGDMGFDGVVITDAMNMDAVAAHFDPLDAAVLAINAGVDILLDPVSPGSDAAIAKLDAYVNNLVRLAENGVIEMDTVNAAVTRILRLKYRHGLFAEYGQPAEDAAAGAKATVGSPEHHETEWALAKRAITMVKNDNRTLPAAAEGKKLLFVAAYPNEVLSMQYGVARLQDEGKLPKTADVSFDCFDTNDINTILNKAAKADYVFAISELYRMSALNPAANPNGACAKLDRVIKTVHLSGGRFVLISAHLPYDAARFPAADAILLCWSDKGMSEDPRVTGGDITQYGPNIPAAVYVALSPDEGPEGKLPVDIPALTSDYTYSSKILYPFGFGLHY